jgi:AcrR family transcriptional regulator
MTPKVQLPAIETINQARADLVASAHASSTRPTVVALARRVGLTNATFWRYFPDIAREIAAAGRDERRDERSLPEPSRLQDLERRNAQLRRSNHDLVLNIKLAEASVQRLALENHQLREELEAISKVTRISGPQRPSRTHTTLEVAAHDGDPHSTD